MFNAYKLYAHTLMWLYAMPKKDNTIRTTLIIDEKLWGRFLKYTFEKYGSAKKASSEIELAIAEYLERHEKRP